MERAFVPASQRREAVFFLTLLSVIAATAWWLFSSFAEKSSATRDLTAIVRALHAYHDGFGRLPPVHVLARNGHRLHSWRTIVLPFFHEGDGKRAYQEFDLRRPWDENGNLAALRAAQQQSILPLNVDPHCRFLAVVNSDGEWLPTDQGTVPSDPVVVLIYPKSNVSLTEPRDVVFDGKNLLFEFSQTSKKKIDAAGLWAVRKSGMVFKFPAKSEKLGEIILRDDSH
jgi:hypothetical protein